MLMQFALTLSAANRQGNAIIGRGISLLRTGLPLRISRQSRRKDLIVRAGSNISPVEVEHVLVRHSAVREAAVIGIPDPILGQRVIGFVRLNVGAPANLDPILAAARPL